MNVQLSKYTVTLKEELTWWEQEEIKGVILGKARVSQSGNAELGENVFLEMKLKLFEKAIVEIKEGENVIPFSVDWVKSLSKADGDVLSSAVDELEKK